MRVLASVMFVTLCGSVAAAQPSDPYGPPSTAPAAASEAVLSEQIAQQLVARAQVLLAERAFADARQLAREALATNAKGAAGEQARDVVRAANKALGLSEGALLGDPLPVNRPVEGSAVSKPVMPPPQQHEDSPHTSREVAARVHTGLLLASITGAIGTQISTDCHCGDDQGDQNGQLGAGIMFGLGGGVVGALIGPWFVDRTGWDEAQVRTAGSTSVWGSVAGMFIADAVHTDGTNPRHVFGGGAIGAAAGAAIGAGIASRHRFTRGDVALVDTFAGIGTVGGLTLGMLMQPAEGEAYSINAALGAAGGYLTGFIAAPLTNTTPRRMVRVAGGAALGGAAPFALYALISDDSSHADERVVGLLSSAGLVVGAYLGFRLTAHMDEGLDTADGKAANDDAPLALIGRSSMGQWSLGAPNVEPLSRVLAPQRGMTFSLLGAAF